MAQIVLAPGAFTGQPRWGRARCHRLRPVTHNAPPQYGHTQNPSSRTVRPSSHTATPHAVRYPRARVRVQWQTV